MSNVHAPQLTVAEVMEPAFDALANEIIVAFELNDEREIERLLPARYKLDHVFQYALSFYRGDDV